MKAKDIIKYLTKHKADFNEVFEDEDWVVISIEWGDWKHSHARLDYLMKEIGFGLDFETMTKTNGSDCYSSEHYFKMVG